MKKEDKKLLEAIVAAMQEKKAKRVVTVDMTKLEAPCQYFVICEGDSDKHVSSIAMEVKDYVHEHVDEKPFAIDGFENAEWIAMDYGLIIVHVFRRETRAFYDIEHLWEDAEIKEYEDVV
ncbi:MAG TPA: ribosome silencing factor [Salinivirgaceae bacterium]|jgi:ribosome-associated protein|nr:ribosome silencing factor [Salinivirgaceae bacterium]HQB68992.1 ribosome silencing factor [Paludibacteraceae bacterium]HRS67185.1 ribosome silencing factor [Paludibacteraceae bacterium]